MQHTLLYDQHIQLGGRMIDFAGWALPIQYPTGPINEHHAVRTTAGLFDIDHMGQFELSGPDADAFLQHIQAWDITQMADYDAHYSLLLYEDGTIVDDIFLYRLPSRWIIAVNAGNRHKDFAWMQAHTMGYDISFTDISDETYMMALQGPAAEGILQQLTQTDLSQIEIRTAAEIAVNGVDLLIGRTGYTGEDGFEIYAPATEAVDLWQQLLATGADAGLLPCGLGARDSLRFEACMPLYGHEIHAQIDPLSARLGWTIAWDSDFIGKEALLKIKLERSTQLLVAFEMIERSVPREHYPILIDDADVGRVTTGMKSPTLNKFLGMGYVPRGQHKIGTEIDIVIRGRSKRAKIVKRPFYRRG